MHVEGIIKSVQASVAAGGADIQQIVKLEIFGEWKDLRDMMQRPLKITLEPSQVTFGETHPALDTTATNGKRGRKKKEVAV